MCRFAKQFVFLSFCLAHACHGRLAKASGTSLSGQEIDNKEAFASLLLTQSPFLAFNALGQQRLRLASRPSDVASAARGATTLEKPPQAHARASNAKMAVGLMGEVLALPTLYCLMSFNEYATHRWYQHEEFNRDNAFQRFCQQVAHRLWQRPLYKENGRRNTIKITGDAHVDHHAETYDDMSLKKDPKWRETKAAAALDHDPYRGTAFPWFGTLIMTLQMLPSTLPAFALLGFSVPQTLGILLPGMLLHACAWNMLHPPMHGLPKVTIKDGAPSSALEFLLDSAYFRYIYENHQGHHVLGGQANYCVCCPLADHLLGTYVPKEAWTKRMRAVPSEEMGERWGTPVAPIGTPQAPILEAAN
jgi:hypothetical protein